MESFWPSSFNPENFLTPAKILNIQADFLPKLTNDVVYAEVLNISDNYNLELDIYEETDFCYQFVLKSKYMNQYKFDVLNIFHDIDVFPLKVYLNVDIAKDLGLNNNKRKIENEEEFKKLLKDVLQSKKISRVVNNILNLSEVPKYPF